MLLVAVFICYKNLYAFITIQLYINQTSRTNNEWQKNYYKSVVRMFKILNFSHMTGKQGYYIVNISAIALFLERLLKNLN